MILIFKNISKSKESSFLLELTRVQVRQFQFYLFKKLGIFFLKKPNYWALAKTINYCEATTGVG